METWLELVDKAQEGEKRAREILVEENLGLVHHIVKRYLGRGYDSEDLFQIGCIGLIKAVDHFDVTYGVQFSTYAVPLIMGEIRRYIRDNTMLKMPRSAKENAIKIKVSKEQLSRELGRDPTIDEIAFDTKLSQEEIVIASDLPWEVDSLSRPIDMGDGSEITLQEKIADKIDTQEDVVQKVFLQELMKCLTDEEKRLIQLRYFENKTQIETAQMLGLTQVQVSRKEKKILRQLKGRI